MHEHRCQMAARVAATSHDLRSICALVMRGCACADATALASDDGTGAGDGLTLTACGSARGEPCAYTRKGSRG